MASFRGSRPHQRQLEQHLSLPAVGSVLSGLLALLCEPVEDNRDVHRALSQVVFSADDRALLYQQPLRYDLERALGPIRPDIISALVFSV
jgi:hypothetical protein